MDVYGGYILCGGGCVAVNMCTSRGRDVTRPRVLPSGCVQWVRVLPLCVVCLAESIPEAAPLSYPLLTYLVGECHYGGRVTDVWDRRTLAAVLQLFVSPAAMKDGFFLAQADGVESDDSLAAFRSAASVSSPADLMAYAATLPSGAPPAAFGLHSNADVVKRELATRVLLDDCLGCEPQHLVGLSSSVAVVAMSIDDGLQLSASEALVDSVCRQTLLTSSPP